MTTRRRQKDPIPQAMARAIVPSEKIEITLPTSQYRLTIVRPRVSTALLMMQLRKQHPRPRPPRVVVEILGKSQLVENTADPDYLAATEEYEGMVSLLFMEALIKMSVQNRPSPEELAEVQLIKEQLAGVVDVDLVDKPYDAWLNYIVIQSDQDQKYLFEQINNLIVPAEEDVAEVEGTFPAKVSANGHR